MSLRCKIGMHVLQQHPRFEMWLKCSRCGWEVIK